MTKKEKETKMAHTTCSGVEEMRSTHEERKMGAVVVSAERRLPKFNFRPQPSRFRYDVQATAGGRNARNFEGAAEVRGEYDVYRGKNGAKVVVGGGVSQDVLRYQGKTYKGKPEANVGIGVEIPIGK